MELSVSRIVPYSKGVSFCDNQDNFYCWLTEDHNSPMFFYYYNDRVDVVFDLYDIKGEVNYVKNLKVIGEDI